MPDQPHTGEARCPTCGETGPDTVSRDFDSGALEADCGDPFHDPHTGEARVDPEDVDRLQAVIDNADAEGWLEGADSLAWSRILAALEPASTEEAAEFYARVDERRRGDLTDATDIGPPE